MINTECKHSNSTVQLNLNLFFYEFSIYNLHVSNFIEAAHYLCELIALLRCALRLAGRITQGKDDRPLIEGRHVFDNLLGECSSDSSHAFMSRIQCTERERERNRQRFFQQKRLLI